MKTKFIQQFGQILLQLGQINSVLVRTGLLCSYSQNAEQYLKCSDYPDRSPVFKVQNSE